MKYDKNNPQPAEYFVQRARKWLNENNIPTNGVCLSLAQLLQDCFHEWKQRG